MVNKNIIVHKTILFLGDITLFYLALILTLLARGLNLESLQVLKIYLPSWGTLFFIWTLVLYGHRLYDLSFIQDRLGFYQNLLKAFLINFLLGLGFFYLMTYLRLPFAPISPKGSLVMVALIGMIFIQIWRRFFLVIAITPPLRQKVVIIGQTENSPLIKELLKSPFLGYEISLLEKDSLTALSKKTPDIVVLAGRLPSSFLKSKSSWLCLGQTEWMSLPAFYERAIRKLPLGVLAEQELFRMLSGKEKVLFARFKRFFDVIVALLVILLFLPIIPLVMLAIKSEDWGAIFYTQPRIGQKEKIFSIIKFRTMKEGQEKITRVGRFLRTTHLDEWPQLFNILKGDMSFVGPRPERPEFVEKFKKSLPYYNLRHLVKPGMTGWAQIHYFYADTTGANFEKLKYDLYYIKHQSFLFDLTITLKTASIVLGTKGR